MEKTLAVSLTQEAENNKFGAGWWCIVQKSTEKSTGDEDWSDSN